MPTDALDPVFGDLRYEREMRDNGTKGNLLARRAWYVREFHGQAALDALIAAVPDPARKYLVEPPLTFAWYPFSVMMDIDRAIVEGPMAGDIGLMKPFGSAIAKHDLPLLYKVLFRVGSPAFVVARLNIAAKAYLRESSVSPEVHDATSATCTLGGRRLPLYFCTYGVSGWFSAAVELSGGQDVSVEHSECQHRGDAACRWQLRWRRG